MQTGGDERTNPLPPPPHPARPGKSVSILTQNAENIRKMTQETDGICFNYAENDSRKLLNIRDFGKLKKWHFFRDNF